jgi:hypothetical protein
MNQVISSKLMIYIATEKFKNGLTSPKHKRSTFAIG